MTLTFFIFFPFRSQKLEQLTPRFICLCGGLSFGGKNKRRGKGLLVIKRRVNKFSSFRKQKISNNLKVIPNCSHLHIFIVFLFVNFALLYLNNICTMAALNLLSVNIRGLNHNIKRKRFLAQLNRFNPDICFTQQTHLKTGADHFLKCKCYSQQFHAPSSSKARGVSILVKNLVNVKV